ncbi:hypothetical protein LP419_40330 [Massilia sp. H-1]|nr:hypothetical protein LP419_40330 [Massilia sp. H-1]
MAQLSVADMAARVTRHYPGVEQIQRTPSGSLIVYYSTDAAPARYRSTRAAARPSRRMCRPPSCARSSNCTAPCCSIRRAALPCRAGALAMVLLSLSGMVLLIKRVGGWRQVFKPLHGNRSQRWHATAGRLAISLACCCRR